MTPEEFAQRMRKIAKEGDQGSIGYDPENAHGAADRLLCEVLTQLGYGEGVQVYESLEKWYA